MPGRLETLPSFLETAGGQCRLNSRIENIGSNRGYKPASKTDGDKRKSKDFTSNVSLAYSRQTLHAYRQWPVYDEGGAGGHGMALQTEGLIDDLLW
jgi:hypothetical protein